MAFKVSERGKCRIIRTRGKYFLEHKYPDAPISTKKLSKDDAFNLVVIKKVSFNKWAKCPKKVKPY